MRAAWTLFTVSVALVTRPAMAEPATQNDLDPAVPPVLAAWRPLRTVSDLPRRLPRAEQALTPLMMAAPRVGLLWTAGNPGALAFEIEDRRTLFWAEHRRQQGGYRRPLDPGELSVTQLSALGWRPIGGRAAAIGHAHFTRPVEGTGSLADVLEPFTSNPLVVADTSRPEIRSTGATLEGGMGWRFGGWGGGLALGVHVGNRRTEAARTPRSDRVSRFGAVAGVTRELPFASLRLGVQFGARGENETVTITAEPGLALVLQLQGYSDPTPIAVAPPSPIYFRRLERDIWWLGAELGRRTDGLRWVLYARHALRNERHFSQQRRDPATDRWSASVDTWGGALQAPLLGRRLYVTAEARLSRLSGDAELFDLDGSIFRAREHVVAADLDLRYSVGRWTLRGATIVTRQSRDREDFIAEVASDIASWTTTFGFEATRELARSTAASVGFASTLHASVSALPNPTSMGPIYQQIFAPELAVYATGAVNTTIRVAIRQALTPGTDLHLAFGWESLRPRGTPATPDFAPDGHRTRWAAMLGIALR